MPSFLPRRQTSPASHSGQISEQLFGRNCEQYNMYQVEQQLEWLLCRKCRMKNVSNGTFQAKHGRNLSGKIHLLPTSLSYHSAPFSSISFCILSNLFALFANYIRSFLRSKTTSNLPTQVPSSHNISSTMRFSTATLSLAALVVVSAQNVSQELRVVER